MRSPRQIEASRANGAKSHGPVTPEGQLASAGNRLDHGLLAAAIVIDGEAADRLAALSEALHEQLQPRDPVELTHVETMIICRWRQIRLWELESANLNHEIRKQAVAHQSEDKRTRAALAFRFLADQSHSLELMNRYETRFTRQFARAYRSLLDHRSRSENPPEYLSETNEKSVITLDAQAETEPDKSILPLDPKPPINA